MRLLLALALLPFAANAAVCGFSYCPDSGSSGSSGGYVSGTINSGSPGQVAYYTGASTLGGSPSVVVNSTGLFVSGTVSATDFNRIDINTAGGSILNAKIGPLFVQVAGGTSYRLGSYNGAPSIGVGTGSNATSASLHVSGTSMLGLCNSSIVCGAQQESSLCYGSVRKTYYVCNGAGSWMVMVTNTMVSASGSM